MLAATCWAAFGGMLWAFGALGKRIGVEGAPPEMKQIRATCTIFVYTLTTSLPPIFSFVEQVITDPESVKDVLNDKDWSSRIPYIILCGAISGLGGVLGTLAFSWSAGSNSALISMVENGMYTVASAAILALTFGNYPKPVEYLAAALIVLGISVAQLTSNKSQTETTTSSDTDTVASHSSDEDRHNMTTKLHVDEAQEESMSEHSEEEADAIGNQRVYAVLIAVLAGIGWGFGPLGKTYGVRDAEPDSKAVQTICTYLVYMTSTCLVPIGKLACADPSERKATFKDERFSRLMLGTSICGLVSGFGGLASTYAFSQSPDHNPIISMVENGVYTVGGALLIAVIFSERPTIMQLCSASLVVAGILVSSTA